MTPRIILVDDYEQLIEAAWTVSHEVLYERRRRFDELGIMTDLASTRLEAHVASCNHVYLLAMQSRRDLLNNSDEGVDHEERVDRLRRILLGVEENRRAWSYLDVVPSTT